MTTRAKVCQYLLIAYLASMIVVGVVTAFDAFGMGHPRSLGLAGLAIAVRGWFLSQVIRRSKPWIWALGVFSAFATLAFPAWLYFHAQFVAPGSPFAWLQPRLLLVEGAMVALAVCCFILESELKKGAEPVATANADAWHFGGGAASGAKHPRG